MKKTVNVNIGGMVFHLDDDAYDKCSVYLSTLKDKFRGVEGGDEIISDIEHRVAEIFKERMEGLREVVNLEDVKYMISVMGEAETIADEEASEVEAEETETQTAAGPKRLYRDPDNRVLGGVCGGFGAYFGIDPMILRIILICLFIFAGTGILLYIIFWIAMPKAVTASDKLMMRGRSVNVNSIERTVKKEWKETKSSLRKVGQQAKSSGFIQGIGKFLRVGFGVVFVITSVIVLASFIWVMVSNKSAIHEVHSNGQELHLSLKEGAAMIFDSFAEQAIAYVSLWLLIVVPAVLFIYLGIRLIIGFKHRARYITLSGFGLWVIGLGLAIYTGINLAEKFKGDARTEVNAPVLVGDSTVIDISVIDTDNIPGYNLEGIPMYQVSFDIVKTMSDSIPKLSVEKRSHGKNRSHAMGLAEDIGYYYSITGNKLELAPYFMLDKGSKFRGQNIRVDLELPVGYRVYLGEHTDVIINDIKNLQDVWDGDMPGHIWQMTETGLSCEDCPDDIIRSGKDKDDDHDSDDIRIEIGDDVHTIEID